MSLAQLLNDSDQEYVDATKEIATTPIKVENIKFYNDTKTEFQTISGYVLYNVVFQKYFSVKSEHVSNKPKLPLKLGVNNESAKRILKDVIRLKMFDDSEIVWIDGEGEVPIDEIF